MIKSSLRFWSTLTITVLAAGAFAGQGQQFGKPEFEKLVLELEGLAPKNPNYIYPIKAVWDESDEFDAYATVEQTKEKDKYQAVMVVSRGAFKFFNNNVNMLRAVVAHEVAHLSHGHCTAPVWKAADLSQYWTRQQEMEADATGAAILTRGGYDKQHMVDMLKKLDEFDEPYWFKINNDHSSPLQRAARVSSDPVPLEALLLHDVAGAYWESRRFSKAADAFDRMYAKEPRYFTAVINSALMLVMDYYDRLPAAAQQKWFRPDFGPLLAPNPLTSSKDPSIGAEDKARWQKAMSKIEEAKKNSSAANQPKLKEAIALAKILNPNNDMKMVEEGTSEFQALLKSAESTDINRRLRFSNNIAVGFQRLGKVVEATDAMREVIMDTGKVNFVLGENFGRVARSNVEGELAVNVMAYWLENASDASPYFKEIRSRYADFCEKLKLKAESFNGRKADYRRVISMVIDGREIGLYDEVSNLNSVAGSPDKILKFEEYSGLNEVRWFGGDITAYIEGKNILRITSRMKGTYIQLQPIDSGVTERPKIEVGMSVDDLKKILNLNIGRTAPLAKWAAPEDWLYFENLLLGVLIEDGKVAGITFAPIQ